MRLCQEDKMLLPGTWYLWKTGKRRILFACPLCGTITMIDEDEVSVSAGGMVAESIRCTNISCYFTDKVLLEGWKG